jgi:hypothetical protein
MGERDQEAAEGSAPGSSDPETTAEDSAYDWEHDARLLNALAELSGAMPLDLLRKISWGAGAGADMASFRNRRPLSAAVRARLHTLLKERMQAEQEIIDNCCHASSRMVQLVPLFVGLAIISSLLIV